MRKNYKEESHRSLMTNENMIFCYTNEYIDSALVFKDGDLLIISKEGVVIFQKKTFKEKLIIKNVHTSENFQYLSEEEFALFVQNNPKNVFILCKFQNNRKSYIEKQKIKFSDEENVFFPNKKLLKLSNNDLLISLNKTIIFRKSENCYDNNKNLYEKTDLFLDQINFYELTEKEIISIMTNDLIKKIELNVFENVSYKKIKSNSIDSFINEEKNKIKRFVCLSSEIFITQNKKIFGFWLEKIYILSSKSLEIESIIKINENINKILVLNNGHLLLQTNNEKKYFIKEIKIDEETNDILATKKDEITLRIGTYPNFFQLYNYLNKGLITITDKDRLVIYSKSRK